jgi:hypothetical protein
MDAAGRWVALADGGQGYEHFLGAHFPRAQQIIDFRQVAGQVAAFAKEFRGGAKAERLVAACCHTLQHAGCGRPPARPVSQRSRSVGGMLGHGTVASTAYLLNAYPRP